jgi:hypothetical protein
MEKQLYDKKGIPIRVGDVLKIYHFTSRIRREKFYMYKWVVGEYTVNGSSFFKINHLSRTIDLNFIFIALKDNTIKEDWEIIQGSDAQGLSFKNRKI